MTTAPQAVNDSTFQLITVTKETGLGLNIVGGINRTEGPLVYIQEVIPGGDCHRDGRLRPGDQCVSINKESLIGVSYEEAKSILTRSKLRPESTWEIAFIRQKGTPSESSSHQRSVSLDPLSSGSKQLAGASGFLPPCEKLTPKMSSTPSSLNTILPSAKPHLTKAGCVKGEQAPIVSADSSSPDLCMHAVAPSRTEDCALQGRKISLNPTVRLKIEKLEMALNYLGIKPTEEQQQRLRQELQIDCKGTVSFGDFVQVARNVFHLQLDEVGIGRGPILFGVNEITNLLDSHSFQPTDSLEPKDLDRLIRERNEAFREIHELKKQLSGSENLRKQLSEELQNVKQDNIQDLRKRITVLDCQLRKSEMTRKTVEVSTEKLLQFVEVIHEVLSDNSASLSNVSDRRSLLSSQSFLTGLGRNDRNITAALSAEAKDLAKSVRSILEADYLPYGWEEAYTADGIKYFINHVTQTTSWIHPVTSALSTTYSEDPDETPEP